MMEIKKLPPRQQNSSLLFLAGEPFLPASLPAADRVFCADGGVKLARQMGLRPDLLIGDGDSLSADDLDWCRRQDCKIVAYPRDKDYTDGELALREAAAYGGSLLVYGGCGGRNDQQLMNLFLAARYLPDFEQICFFAADSALTLLNPGSYALSAAQPERFSLLALTPQVQNIVLTGAAFAIKDETLVFGQSRGISNLLTGAGHLSFGTGVLLLIRFY